MYDVIIVGAGASGLMCAVECENQKLNYLLLEKNSIPGKKILISGGTRCNVTNNLDVEEFIGKLTIKNNKFLYPALYSFGPTHVLDFLSANNLECVLENNFKYFPKTNKAQSVVDALIRNINLNRIEYHVNVNKIEKDQESFIIHTNRKIYKSKNVVIATGSKSFPKTGSTGFGLEVAKTFDVNYTDFTAAETHMYSRQVVKNLSELQGTSITSAHVKVIGTNIEHNGDLLFTHFGLSGPAIYHLSEFLSDKKEPTVISISFTNFNDSQLRDLFNTSGIKVLKLLEQCVSKRVARKILNILQLENKNINELSKNIIDEMIETLLRYRITIDRVEDREKAYVNKGGISLSELHPSSMESKKIKGLYFIGETVDVHGPIGGFNITIAFATGYLTALAIKEKLEVHYE